MKKIFLSVLAVLVIAGPVAAGQDQYLELLRQNMRTQKVGVVTDAMALTSEQSDTFWPIYREYDAEMVKLWDARIAIIEDYAANYVSMDDETADRIASKAIELSEKFLKLRTKYYKEMKKELGAVVAARFWQIDGTVQGLVELQISSEIPLVQRTGSAKQAN